MNEEEDIVGFSLRVDEVMNTIGGFSENINESLIVQKTLRSLPLICNAKVSTIKEIKYLENMKFDELHGILFTYEMRIEKEKL